MLRLSRRIMVSAPKETVALYLRDLRRMADYERKVDRVELGEGGVEASGRFLGLRWSGAFRVEATRDGGYRGELVRGPLGQMSWGFHLRAVSGGTVLTHEEHYLFHWLFKPLVLLLRGRLRRAMELELAAIKEAAERLHRQIQIREIEAAL